MQAACRRKRTRLLLVRESGTADRIRQSEPGRACRNQLYPRRGEPPWVTGSDGQSADIRGLERRAVDYRRRSGTGVAGLLFSGADDELMTEARLDGAAVDEIYADLTALRGGVGVRSDRRPSSCRECRRSVHGRHEGVVPSTLRVIWHVSGSVCPQTRMVERTMRF